MKKDISGTDKKIIKNYLSREIMRGDHPTDWDPFRDWNALNLLCKKISDRCWNSTSKDWTMNTIVSKICHWDDKVEDARGLDSNLTFRGIWCILGSDPERITRAIYETYIKIDEKERPPNFNSKQRREMIEKRNEYKNQIEKATRLIEDAQRNIEEIEQRYLDEK